MEAMDLAQLLRDVIEEFDDGEEASIDIFLPDAEPNWCPSPDVVRRIKQALHDLDVEVLTALKKQNLAGGIKS